MDAIDGFELPFHDALSEPVTLAGVPHTAAVLIGGLTAILALGLQTPWIGLPLGAVLYAVALWMAKRDPYVFDILGRHLRQPSHLDG